MQTNDDRQTSRQTDRKTHTHTRARARAHTHTHTHTYTHARARTHKSTYNHLLNDTFRNSHLLFSTDGCETDES